MDRPRASRRITAGAFYALGCGAFMAVQLTPHDIRPGAWLAPDLMLCLTLAWVLRRPDEIPAILVAAVFLAADLLFQRPPGLGAALAVIATEIARDKVATGRPLLLPGEWALVSGLCLGMAAATWGALGITLAPRPDLGQLLLMALTTAAAYPPTVVLLRSTGIRRSVLGGAGGAA